MDEYKIYFNKWKWLIFLVGITISVYMGFQYLLPLILPFLISLLLARMVSPIVKTIKNRWNIPTKLAAPIVLLMVMAILFVILSCFGVSLFNQIRKGLTNFPIYQNKFNDYIGNVCVSCDDFFGLSDGDSWRFVSDNMDNFTNVVVEKFVPTMTQKTIMAIIWVFGAIAIIFVVFISALLILEDMDELRLKYQESKVYPYLYPILRKLGSAGVAFVRAQAIILGGIAVSCSVGLWLIGNPYSLILGILIAVLDALPFIGSGIMLIPWAVVQLINGNFYHASVLITLYAICLAIREILEPKLIGNRVGVRPIFIIMASFIGIKLFGLGGVFLGPIGLVMIKVTLESLD